MSDLECCIAHLEQYKMNYFVREAEGGNKELICYSPYATFDPFSDELIVHCYVYHWIDTYTNEGKYIKHEAYEALYTTNLDYTI